MKFLPTTFKIWLLKRLYKDIASLGSGGDTELAHINKWESNLLVAHWRFWYSQCCNWIKRI